jgi:hypothetical protein
MRIGISNGTGIAVPVGGARPLAEIVLAILAVRD